MKTPAEEVLPFLNLKLQSILSNLSPKTLSLLEEIRLRSHRPLQLITREGEIFLNELGEEVTPSQAYHLTLEDMQETLRSMSRSSLYALEEELRQGYLTLPRGHRVGFVGRGVLKKGEIATIKDIASFNIRISREIHGAANGVVERLIIPPKGVYHTLILSPPGGGKTTILRDLARILSDGSKEHSFQGVKVGVIDERSEIGGAYKGAPQNRIGLRTDLFDGVPKALGMEIMIRSLSPEVLITDELGGEGDAKALHEALRSGVTIITSAHASSLQEIQRSPSLSSFLHLFQRYILLSRREGPGTLEGIWDRDFKVLQGRDRHAKTHR